VLAPYLKPSHKAIASINSPMQCMMKEICAQCLQPHKRPGHRQDHLRVSRASTRIMRSTEVDFPGLAARLRAEFGAGKADRAVDRPAACITLVGLDAVQGKTPNTFHHR